MVEQEFEASVQEMEAELRNMALKIWMDLSQPAYISDKSKGKSPKIRSTRRRQTIKARSAA
jgi:hypothetical protein